VNRPPTPLPQFDAPSETDLEDERLRQEEWGRYIRASELPMNVARALEGESERGAVLIATANIEHALMHLLISVLQPSDEKVDELFGWNGQAIKGYAPLNQLSLLINLAFRLGQVDKSFKKTLHDVREIRNEFAHSPTDISLSDFKRYSKVNNIIAIVDNSLSDEARSITEEFKTDLKSQYVVATHHITSLLSFRTHFLSG